MSKNTANIEQHGELKPAKPAPITVKKDKIIDLEFEITRSSCVAIFEKNKDNNYTKPCEDYHIADNENQIFILMDGATRYATSKDNYPTPSPAAIAAQIASDTSHRLIQEFTYSDLRPSDLLLAAAMEANEAVAEYNSQTFAEIDYLENDYANACGILSFIKGKKFHFAYVGDPQGYLIRDGKIILFTENQVERIDALYEIYSQDASKNLVDFRIHVCKNVRNNPLNEHPFGSFTGDVRALELLEFGSFDIQKGDRIILTSDGLLPLFSANKELFYQTNYQLLIEQMEKLEIEKAIRSDDKTLIAIDIL